MTSLVSREKMALEWRGTTSWTRPQSTALVRASLRQMTRAIASPSSLPFCRMHVYAWRHGRTKEAGHARAQEMAARAELNDPTEFNTPWSCRHRRRRHRGASDAHLHHLDTLLKKNGKNPRQAQFHRFRAYKIHFTAYLHNEYKVCWGSPFF